MRKALVWWIAVSSALAIAGTFLHAALVVYAFKPLTTLLIFKFALTAPATGNRYKRAILAGLVFSMAGDVFLMLPSDLFLPGLVSFLIAHVCYLIAFTSDARFGDRASPFLVVGVVSVAILSYLWPGVPVGMRIPVVVYVVLLASMAAQSSVRALLHPGSSTMCAAIGGALFVVSDAMLAVARFRSALAGAGALVLATYYAAQFLIAASVPNNQMRNRMVT